MSDVSCRIIDGMLQFMEKSRISLDAVHALLPLIEPDGRSVTYATLRSERERIRWSTFVKVFRACGPLFDDEKTQRAFVDMTFAENLGWVAFARPTLRLLLRPERMYAYIQQAAGSAMFSNLKSSIKVLPDGRIEAVLEIPPGDEALPEFFAITALTLPRIPTVAGWPAAQVQSQCNGRRGEFLITPPLVVSFWRRLLIRVKLLLGAGASLRDIGQSHATVLDLHHQTLRSEGELRLIRAELESRVQERTSALELAVDRLEREATDRRAAEDRAAVLGRLLEESSQEIYIMCAETQRFLTANASALRNLGYTLDELQCMTPADVSMSPPDEVRLRLHGMTSGKVKRLSYRTTQRRKNGETYPVEVDIQSSHWEGKPVVVGILVDITDRVRAEAERHQLMNELLAAQRRQAVGSMAGGVAHEFNNILTPILAHTTIIAAETSHNPRALESLERIEKAVLRGRDVVRQILALASESAAPAQLVKLMDVVAEAVALFRPTLPPHVTLSCELLDQEAQVRTSAAEIHQIVLNLLTNATHAMAESGGQLRITVEANDKSAVLSVIDAGVGMDEATRQRIFEPFFTTKRDGKGTGLGLTIVRDIATRHGAEMIVDSKPGKGSCFSIVFPRAHAMPTSDGAVVAAPTPDTIDAGRAQVLLVDDEKEISFVLSDVLRLQGFDTVSANTPEEAIALVSRNVNRFDVVITDMSMPTMTGLELAQVLKALAPRLSVCLLTGYSQITPATAQSQGIAALFAKPIEPSALAAGLRSVLNARAATPS